MGEESDTTKIATTMSLSAGTNDLTPFMGCCCGVCSFYFVFPDCIGCWSKGTLCCLDIEALCCKVGKKEGSICMCMQNEIEVIWPPSCKIANQVFCLDNRCAIPCDEEVPCVVTVFGIQCCKHSECKPGCCKKLGDEEEGGAPQSCEMAR